MFSLQDSLQIPGEAATRERFALAWSELLYRAVAEPGLICDAYTRFHIYSLGNHFEIKTTVRSGWSSE